MYAAGGLPPARGFYFRGPAGKLNLRVQHLARFLQVAGGVGGAIWLYHLRRGEDARWFRETIEDDELAATAERVERQAGDSAQESRRRIRAAVERRYPPPT
jgi:hypothetical protein